MDTMCLYTMTQQTGSLGLNNSLPIVALSLFYVSFTLGFGGLPFVILGEMFPPGRQKSLAISLSVSCIWILNFVNTKSEMSNLRKLKC